MGKKKTRNPIGTCVKGDNPNDETYLSFTEYPDDILKIDTIVCKGTGYFVNGILVHRKTAQILSEYLQKWLAA